MLQVSAAEASLSVPKQALNWRFYLAAGTMGLLGAARGLDEGIISSQTSSKAFIDSYGVLPGSALQSEITSFVQLACCVGALLAWWSCDRLGRVRCAQIHCIAWIAGAALWITSRGSVGQLLVGRFVTGIGIGGTVVCGPTYLSEISPDSLRGAAVGFFSSAAYVGVLLGFSFNVIATRYTADTSFARITIPTSLNFICAVVPLFLTQFIPESPRWLLKRGREPAAVASLCWLRQVSAEHAYVRAELDGMREQLRVEREAKGPRWRWYHAFDDLFCSRDNAYILALLCGVQVFGQLSGAGSITIYAPQLFAIVAGPAGSRNTGIYLSAVFGALKLAAALLSGLFVLDRFGRKRAALAGMALQMLGTTYLAAYLRAYPPAPAGTHVAASPAQNRAATAAIVMMYITGIGWAAGANSIQYLLASELFPMTVRSLGSMLVMVTHFLFQWGASRAVNPMIAALAPSGLFAFWAGVSGACIVLIVFFLPEPAGRSLEHMRELFQMPWYKIGLSSMKPYRRPAVQKRELQPDAGLGLHVGVELEESACLSHSSYRDRADSEVEAEDDIDRKRRSGIDQRRTIGSDPAKST